MLNIIITMFRSVYMPNITPAVEDVYVNDRGPYGQGVYISSYF